MHRSRRQGIVMATNPGSACEAQSIGSSRAQPWQRRAANAIVFLDALQCGKDATKRGLLVRLAGTNSKRARTGTVSNVSLPISRRRRRGRDCNKCRAYATCMCDADEAGHIQPCASSSSTNVGPSTPATPVGVPVVPPHVGLFQEPRGVSRYGRSLDYSPYALRYMQNKCQCKLEKLNQGFVVRLWFGWYCCVLQDI